MTDDHAPGRLPSLLLASGSAPGSPEVDPHVDPASGPAPGPDDAPLDPLDPLALAERLHATAHLLVYDFAGAGSMALAWLHAVGGSSRTVLEAVDRYAPASLAGAIGFEPARSADADVAEALAASARERASRLAPDGAPLLGAGLAATIATDRVKRGGHRIYAAVRDGLGTARVGLEPVKGARERAGEEGLASRLLLRLLADASGVLGVPALPLRPDEALRAAFRPEGDAARFGAGELDWLLIGPDGTPGPGAPPEGAVIVSGAFHPVHHGHLGLAEVASRMTGGGAVFEIPLANAEKPGIDLSEARRRAAQFAGRAPVLLSRSPLFVDKARLWPGRTFAIGADTAARLVDPRFYGGSEARLGEALRALRAHGARFLVAVRAGGGRVLRLADAGVAEEHADLFRAIPEGEFRMDLSSTEVREGWGGAGPPA